MPFLQRSRNDLKTLLPPRSQSCLNNGGEWNSTKGVRVTSPWKRTPCVCVHRANKWPNSLHSRLNAKQPRHRVIALSMQISLRIRRFVSTVRFDSTLSLQRTYELQRYWRTAVSVELSIPFFLFSTLSYRNRY